MGNNEAVSSWAGIESVAAGESAAARPAPIVADHPASEAFGRRANGRRRLRRETRPVIGSLDGAGVMVQRNTRELVLGSAWILLPGVVLNLVATSLAFDRYQSLKGSTVSIPELLGGQKAATGIEQLLWYLGLVVNSLAACLVGGFVATLVVARRTGGVVRIRSGYRSLVRRLPALFVAWLVGHCWFPLVALALSRLSDSDLAPLAILGAPLVLVAATLTVVVAPAIVVEQLGPFAGLRRGIRMARTSFGVLLSFVLASMVIGLLVQYGIAYLPRLLQAIGLISFGRFGWLIEGVAGQLGRLISVPLVAVATALVYLEMRMKTEGMDIVLDADLAFPAISGPS
ncbi:MAG: hypothetical protein JWM34_4514 [Ilumatobacteraceae bacterium]|nr:hypothetical protein [Ilumatobacteraceae bacterium]